MKMQVINNTDIELKLLFGLAGLPEPEAVMILKPKQKKVFPDCWAILQIERI